MRRRWRLGPALNWALIVPVIGGALLAVGLGLLACLLVALIGGDGATLAFALPAAVCLPAAVLAVLSGRRLPATPLRARDGFFAVTMSWVVAAAVGAFPFVLSASLSSPTEAFFEAMSGFTTTGATVIDVVEREPDAILLWRSVSQWIGGIGIVVLVVAIAPATGLASQRVFHAETSGVTAERLTPRIADTAKIVLAIYGGLSALALGAYWLAGMALWDAINHAMTTVATAGFSTRTLSIAGFDSVAIEVVAIVFMIAGGVNFALYWRALRGDRNLWPQLAELRAYLLILAGATAAVTVVLVGSGLGLDLAASLRAAAFTVTSVVTTTGYTTADYDVFPDSARILLVAAMFVGGCAGSTAGGMKVVRVLLLVRTAGQEVQRQLQPRAVQVLRIRGRVYSEEVRRGVLGFFYLYVTVFLAGSLAMAVTGLDVITALSSSFSTLNTFGPGFGQIGAVENYAAVSPGGLWVLSALMLIGRLEVFTVLVLLTPVFWRPSTA